MSKKDKSLTRRTQAAPPELHAAAAQWGEAATRMLLQLETRVTELETRVADLEGARATPDTPTRRGTP